MDSTLTEVTGRWHPEDASRPILDEVPVFYPNEEEFKDFFKYIASIRQCAEPYGLCRIIPPPSWNPPCCLKEKTVWENSSFSTSVQQLDMLQNRKSTRKMPRNHMRKRRRISRKGIDEAKEFGFEPGVKFTFEKFQKFADDFKEQYFCMKNADNMDNLQQQWEPSMENIEGEYWRIVEKPTEEIEVLYGADIQTAVFGSGFPKSSTEAMDSDSKDEYVKSEWNLNNISRLPGSMLSFESGDISGVMLPWLYVGMCFSSFCWHVEDHHLYSLNYLHWGAPKVWYGVPGKDASKFEATMKKHLPDLFEQQPDLLHKLVTQLSPSIFKSEDVPVYRCVQHPREFILTFPRAYHAGFNSGFNCAEALNIAPIDWLPYGQRAVELYQEQGRSTTLSHDKLLLGAAREAVRAHWELQLLRKDTFNNLRWKDVTGKNGILTQALKTRVLTEGIRRKCFASQSMKMDIDFDANTERECIICHYDLHLSAVGCQCSPGRYACLMHAKELCSCAWTMRSFLFRYELDELNLLVEALGGRLSAIYRWANKHLGLSLSSYGRRSNSQESKPIGGGLSTGGAKQKEERPSIATSSAVVAESTGLCKEINITMSQISSPEVEKEREQRRLNSTGTVIGPSMQQQERSQLPSVNPQTKNRRELGDMNKKYRQGTSLSETNINDHSIQFNKGALSSNSSSLILPVYKLFQEDSPYCARILTEANSQQFAISAPEDKHLRDCNTLESKQNTFPLSGSCNVTNNNEGEDAQESMSNLKHSEIPVRLTESDGKLTSCNYQDQILNTPRTNASMMNERDTNDLIMERMKHALCSVHKKVGDRGTSETSKNKNSVSTETFFQNATYNTKYVGEALVKEIQDSEPCKLANSGDIHRHHYLNGSVKLINSSEDGKFTVDFCSKVENTAQSVLRSPSCRAENCDSFGSQEDPCVANVVGINYVVESLEYGVVLPGKLWSNSKTIFPKGFRSRVRYLSVLDPAEMCYYISEILDAALPGPVFMVLVEQCPSEVFINLSADKCWDMVRERVNQKIMDQSSWGKTNLPPLQPLGCLNGLEMFGFCTPAIIQAIEAIDCKHICSEYWNCRPRNPKPDSLLVSTAKHILHKIKEEPNDSEFNNKENPTLRGLLKKANLEELCSLLNMLSGNECNSDREALVRLLNREIHYRRNKRFGLR
ncbi:hypothetical protein AAC387_Pa05g0452 [Persea americana]